jgi:hypothetical protein
MHNPGVHDVAAHDCIRSVSMHSLGVYSVGVYSVGVYSVGAQLGHAWSKVHCVSGHGTRLFFSVKISTFKKRTLLFL